RAHSEVAHLPTGHAGFIGDIAESAVAVIAVESVLYRRFRSVKIGWSTVDQIDVHPAIVIKIEEEATATAGLRKMSQLRAAVVMNPRDLTLRCRHFSKRHSL